MKKKFIKKKEFFTMEDHLEEINGQQDKIENNHPEDSKIIIPQENQNVLSGSNLSVSNNFQEEKPDNFLAEPLKTFEKQLGGKETEESEDIKKENAENQLIFNNLSGTQELQENQEKEEFGQEKVLEQKKEISLSPFPLPPLPPSELNTSSLEKEHSEKKPESVQPLPTSSTFNSRRLLKVLGVILGLLVFFAGGYFAISRFWLSSGTKVDNPLVFLPQKETVFFLQFNFSKNKEEIAKIDRILENKTGGNILRKIEDYCGEVFDSDLFKDFSYLDNLILAYLETGNGLKDVFIVDSKNHHKELLDKFMENQTGEEKYQGVKIIEIKKASKKPIYLFSTDNYLVFSGSLESLKKVISVYKNPKENISFAEDEEKIKHFEEIASDGGIAGYADLPKYDLFKYFKYKSGFLVIKSDGDDALKIETRITQEEDLEVKRIPPQLISFFPHSTFMYAEANGEHFKKMLKDSEIINKFLNGQKGNLIIKKALDLLGKNFAWGFVQEDLYGLSEVIIIDVKDKERSFVVQNLIEIEKTIEEIFKENIKNNPNNYSDRLLEKIKFVPISYEGKTIYALPGDPSLLEVPGVTSFNFAYFDNKVFFTNSFSTMKKIISTASGKAPSFAQNPYVSSFEGLQYPASSYGEINFEGISEILNIVENFGLKKDWSDLEISLFEDFKKFKHLKMVEWVEGNISYAQYKIIFK